MGRIVDTLFYLGTAEFEDFVFRAGFLDHENPIESWKALGKKHQRAIEYLSNKKELHFKNSNGTDLRVNISVMKWVNLLAIRINQRYIGIWFATLERMA